MLTDKGSVHMREDKYFFTQIAIERKQSCKGWPCFSIGSLILNMLIIEVEKLLKNQELLIKSFK